MPNKEELAGRRNQLLAYLKTDTNKWFTQREICDNVKGYTYIENPKHTADHCTNILSDKEAINHDIESKDFVVCKKYMFKVATREEAKEDIRFHIRKLRKQKKLIDDLVYKLDAYDQISLIGEMEIALDENGGKIYE